jgi:hypothetical protein
MATKIFDETDPKVVDGTYDVYGYTPKDRRLQLKRRQAAADELYEALKDCCAALGGIKANPDNIPVSALAALKKADGR